MNRHFKGIWIPSEIWLIPKLSANARILWSEIDSLYSEEQGGCFASDKYLMKILGLSRAGLHRVLKELKKENIIVSNRQTGSRVIQSTNRQVAENLVLQNSKILAEYGLNKKFKGIWIPSEILLMPELSTNAKVLWAEIDSLYSEEQGGCFASDKYLMKLLGLRLSRLHEVLKELKKHGLIVNVNDNGDNEFKNRGRNRVIKAIHPSAEKLVEKQSNLTENEKSTFSKVRHQPSGKRDINLPENETSTFRKVRHQPSGKRDINLPENETSTFRKMRHPIYKDYNKEENKEEGEKKANQTRAISTLNSSTSFSTSSAKTEQKNSYGEFQHVKLDQTEYDKLQTRLGQENLTRMIKRLDLYVGQTGKRYKSHYMTILKWNDDDAEKDKKTNGFSLAKHRQGSKLAFETETDTWRPPALEKRVRTPEEKAAILKEFGVAL